MTRRSPHGLPMLKFHGLRFPRTAAEAFRDATYGACMEVYIRPGLWPRILQLLRKRFAS